jgi:predicted TIM-barrel fold metal-dependent hydrolase
VKGDSIVFDAVVHIHDFRDEVMVHEDARHLREATHADLRWTARRGQTVSHESADRPPPIDWARQTLFSESDTDFAMVQTVPLFGLFKDGMAPAAAAYELARSDPQRFLFCGGVDPLYQGVKGAKDEMTRQVEEWGAVSFKFYQAQTMSDWWQADDIRLAYPLFERAQELGIKLVQFHKGLPLGHQRVEALRPNDLQAAAYDFPDLTFGIHHMGDPYIDETISIAARFENIVLILPLLFNQYFVQPLPMVHRLGKALLNVGEDRLCYGTDAFLWPQVQLYIDLMSSLQFSPEMQEDYGYPEITPETRAKILGGNFARVLDIDLEARLKAIEATHER